VGVCRCDPSGSLSAEVATDDSGTAVVIWASYVPTTPVGGYFELLSNRHTAEGWTGPETLDDSGGFWDDSTAQVAMDATGGAVVVWQDAELGIQARGLSGGVWGPSVRLGELSGMIPVSPRLAMSGNGDAFVVWTKMPPEHGIEAASLEAGSWGAPVTISSDSVNYSSYPSVAVDGNGNAVAIWLESQGSVLGGDVEAAFCSASTGAANDTALIAIIVVATIAAVAGVVVFLLVRRGRKA